MTKPAVCYNTDTENTMPAGRKDTVTQKHGCQTFTVCGRVAREEAMNPAIHEKILRYQRNEITEHLLYGILADRARGNNERVLRRISDDELNHYTYFRKLTGREIAPDRWRILFFRVVSFVFGLTFTLKMMENGESKAEHNYEEVEAHVPGIKRIIREERRHEAELIEQIEEDALRHLGSMVLAINNSIQEITGIVVGLTFALANALLVGKTALISGIAATLAMVASEYLSQKAESADPAAPKRAAMYTGAIYIFVVSAVVTPYFVFSNHYAALGAAIGAVVIIVTVFTFFMSVVKSLDFKKALAEVSLITAGVVVLSLMAGMGMRMVFGD